MGLLTELPEGVYPNTPFLLAGNQEFDLPTARALAWASQLAYEVSHPDKVDRLLSSWGWRLVKPFAGHFSSILPMASTKGFVASVESTTILAFAGTEPTSLANWITDFTLFGSGRSQDVHPGFEAGVDEIWGEIKGPLSAETDTLYLAGHSLGGALAVVAAERLFDEDRHAGEQIRGVYTIGMPRAGDAAWAGRYNAALGPRTFRLVYGVDIVPTVPPADAPFSYRHVGRELRCDHGSRFDPAALKEALGEPEPQGGLLSHQGSVLSHLVQAAIQQPLRPKLPLPPYPRQDFVGTLIDNLPPVIRDHVPDRYLSALSAPPTQERL